ncbi:MAG: hypothetical protein JSV84_04905, partial [Gemmatimonadota bacterium]
MKLKTVMCWLIVTLAIPFLFSGVAFGKNARPGLINAQGRLVEPDGTLIHGNRDMAFCIYTDPTGGELLWGDTLSVLVWGGVYDIMLGPIPQEVFYDSVSFNEVVRLGGDRWLGITVIGDSEMQPRERIATVGYTIHADMIDGRDASEFISSVHPDSAVGLDTVGKADRCRNTIPMLTVINDCDGVAIDGKCLTGTGVTGAGKIGVLGLASQAGDTSVFAQAVHPDSIAGQFDGNVTLNGDGQLGLSGTDYHHLKLPGSQAWGWLYGPKPLDSIDAMDVGYNYHVDPTGTELYDNSGMGRGTSRIRLGHGWLLFTAGSAMQRPDTVMYIDPNGKVGIKGGVCGPRLDCDTLRVSGPGSSEWAWIGGSSPAEADSACPVCTAATGGNCHVGGSVGIGAVAPTTYQLHVSGSSSGHIARFENTNVDTGDGIGIKINAKPPGTANRYLSFLGSNSKARGRVEGMTSSDLDNDPYVWTEENFYKYSEALAIASLVAEASAVTFCVAFPPFLGIGAATCKPGLTGPIVAAALLVWLEIEYRVVWKNKKEKLIGV